VFELNNISSDPDPLAFSAKLCAEEYAWRLNSWVRAEALGFRGIFFSEHHFNSRQVCPSPNLLAAVVASRTRDLRIGVLGLVLPMWQPWRAVEDIGVLDQISNGRYEEALDILDIALAEPSFSHHGRFWSFDCLTVLPRPVQKPMPAPWATVRSIASAAAAGRRGYRICTAFLNTHDIQEVFDAYRKAAVNSGHPVNPGRLAIRRSIFVAHSAAEADEHAEISGRLIPSLPADDIIAGTARDVAEEIVEQMRDTGAGNIMGFFAGNWVDRMSVEESYRLFGQEVIPVLKRA
jgi:alkanesulfonate monooxygenase SsuD/methylene tetrahydromethanopterin reductase-like flavin-dependent oxidoreductase (luciferase family)